MRWFRYWAEALDDDKVQALPGPLFKHWVNLLCIACYNKGEIDDLKQAAFRLRLPPRRAEKVVAELVNRGLLEPGGDGWAPHNWAGRQFASDESAKRVERYRGRVRAAGQQVGGYLQYREIIMDRDGHRCVYCGGSERLCIDHAIPVQLGGGDGPNNLMTACKQCNSGKAGRTPEQAGFKFHNKAAETVYLLYASRLHAPADTVTVTPPEADTEQNRTEPETEAEAENNIFTLYEKTVGPFDPHMATLLEEAEKEYSWEDIQYAFDEASENDVRTWRYIEAILKSHKANGCYAGRRGVTQERSTLEHDELHRRYERFGKPCPFCHVPEGEPEDVEEAEK